jgi:RNA polymerase sigma-70 factor, ECF subfamily
MSSGYACATADQPQRNGKGSTELTAQIAAEIPFLRRAARRWQRQKPDADDLVQDTLLQALANAHLWQPGSNLRAWLFTIMRNQFFAAAARSSRGAALLQLSVASDPTPVDDAREARLVLRDVGAVLGRLPVKQRMALRLAGVEGKSYEEVAAAMGLTVGAVRCHLARGRDRLRLAVRGSDTSPFAQYRAGHALRPQAYAAALAD